MKGATGSQVRGMNVTSVRKRRAKVKFQQVQATVSGNEDAVQINKYFMNFSRCTSRRSSGSFFCLSFRSE